MPRRKGKGAGAQDLFLEEGVVVGRWRSGGREVAPAPAPPLKGRCAPLALHIFPILYNLSC